MDANHAANVDPSSGQFVDPLFAIFIASAVAQTIVPWTTTNAWSDIDVFEICVVSLGFVNLLLSWFGYHKSVAKHPIEGSLRFIVTVVLLPLYLLTIIMYESDFYYVAYIYAIVFICWTCWGYLKDVEHGIEPKFLKRFFRVHNLIVYMAALLLFCTEHMKFFNVDNADWYVLVSVAFAVFWLRITSSANTDGSSVSKIKSEVLNLLIGKRSSN